MTDVARRMGRTTSRIRVTPVVTSKITINRRILGGDALSKSHQLGRPHSGD